MTKTVGARIKQRRKQLGLSADRIAEMLGRDRSTYYRYESDEIENMPVSVLTPLARILGVSEAYLLSGEHPAARRIPILGAIAAGEPIYAVENYDEFIEVTSGAEVDFALRVFGDSMIDARIHDGDLVFVRRQPTVENGEIAVVLIDDEATLKRFYRTDHGVILKPENAKYQPMYYTAENFKDVRILGKAVLFQSKL